MERLPDPPSVRELLTHPAPDIRTFKGGALFWRLFFRDGKYPVLWNTFRHFGPTTSRFDHHPVDPPARDHWDHAILYLAMKADAAFGEFFQGTRLIDRNLQRPSIVQFAVRESISLLDVTGSWMVKVGGGAAISSGDRTQSRKWSRLFHEAFPSIDGVLYRSSLNPSWLLLALYERAHRTMPDTPNFRVLLTDPTVEHLVKRAARVCNYDVV